MTTVVEARGLRKDFGALRALHGLDLSIEAGEVFGYLGPNGAGKTTTIRLLFDFIRPTAGSVSVLGGSGADPAVRRRVGYLPADLPVPRRHTANDVFDFYGALRGGFDRRWVDQLLQRFELDPTRPVGQLSTGNRRKVGIVQAVAHRPEFVVLDEPSSGLDPLLQREFALLVRELVSDGATVLMSSHVLPEVEELADRVGILRAGRLVRIATVDELRQQARQRIELRTTGAADCAAFAALPGVVDASADGNIITITVEGSVDAVIKVAAQFEVDRIVTHETPLEEIFLGFYEGSQ
ncbi:MAG: ABC transporter ATP-binding protein [Mycobacteriales bacterium]